MKKWFTIFPALLILACEDPILVEIPEGPVHLVIEGQLNDQLQPQIVRISTTESFNSPDQTPAISGAVVSVVDENGSVNTFTETNNPGIYHSTTPFAGRVDTSYKLRVVVNGQTYESDFQALKPVAPIEFLSFEQDEFSENEEYLVSVNTIDPSTTGDFYRWRVFKNGNQLGTLKDIFLRSDRLFNSNPFDVKLDAFSFQRGDICAVVQMSLSENAFDFFRLIQIQAGGLGESTSPPATQVRGNIRNINQTDEVVLGYFYASSLERAEILIQP